MVIPGEVFAVVVSFNGGPALRHTIDALRGQVGHVHVVDNGSCPETLALLESLETESPVTVERLGENRGVGFALNIGVKRASERGYSWLLTMDQDSIADPEMIEAYANALERRPQMMCLVPRLTGDGRPQDTGLRVVASAITSGNLVRLQLFDAVGLYDESLFIDGIDFDFSLRVRRAGHGIYRVGSAVMQHQLGEAVDGPAFLNRYYAQHSAVRRYYMCRNFLYLTRKHFFHFPGFISKLALAHAIHMLLIGFRDPHPADSYHAIVRGLRDFASHRSGPFREIVS